MMSNASIRRFGPWFAGIAIAALCSWSTPAARAAVDPEIRAGVYPGAEAVSLGGGLLMEMGEQRRWYFNPNLEATIAGDDFVALSGDVHYDFPTSSNTAFWMGAGPALFWYERPGRGDETDLGVNVLTGVGAKRGQVRPFAQLRGTLADEKRIAIAGGLRF